MRKFREIRIIAKRERLDFRRWNQRRVMVVEVLEHRRHRQQLLAAV